MCTSTTNQAAPYSVSDMKSYAWSSLHCQVNKLTSNSCDSENRWPHREQAGLTVGVETPDVPQGALFLSHCSVSHDRDSSLKRIVKSFLISTFKFKSRIVHRLCFCVFLQTVEELKKPQRPQSLSPSGLSGTPTHRGHRRETTGLYHLDIFTCFYIWVGSWKAWTFISNVCTDTDESLQGLKISWDHKLCKYWSSNIRLCERITERPRRNGEYTMRIDGWIER